MAACACASAKHSANSSRACLIWTFSGQLLCTLSNEFTPHISQLRAVDGLAIAISRDAFPSHPNPFTCSVAMLCTALSWGETAGACCSSALDTGRCRSNQSRQQGSLGPGNTMFAAPPARGLALPAVGAPQSRSCALPRSAALRWSCRGSALTGRSLQKVRNLQSGFTAFQAATEG